MNKIVLLLDDDQDDLDLLADLIKDFDPLYTCLSFTSVMDALSFMTAEESPTPDVIITDINMPRVSGVEFIRKVKKMERVDRCPMVALSTCMDNRTAVRMLEAGADFAFEKPRDVDSYMNIFSHIFNTDVRVRLHSEKH